MFGSKNELQKELSTNEDFLAKGLKIGVEVDDIMAEFNAYDWVLLKDQDVVFTLQNFKERTGFTNPDNQPIRDKAFEHKFTRAVKNLSALVEEVHKSYKIPSGKGISNPEIERYYYLKYWADKKSIAVDYNEKDFNKRKLFNFYTILFDIFANNLANFNTYSNQKQAKK